MPSPTASETKTLPSLRGFDWHNVYFDSVLETNSHRAVLKMKQARKILTQRLLELEPRKQHDPDELRDLRSALTYLGILLALSDESSAAVWAATA